MLTPAWGRGLLSGELGGRMLIDRTVLQLRCARLG